ncbi:phospholipase D-like domain-containing protein [Gandjariella thermophila]|uniref:phospholipase D n=1 Tax=Gandjariella thermophila TaxID=1931992 RepID=A0A4D4J6G1_9PSEU|nr:phospholipase D-like domain-containing protein [Gandjariella thermophila]GDY30096.1 hypothetical protein GTS_17290 [Gandjariella thermophila]
MRGTDRRRTTPATRPDLTAPEEGPHRTDAPGDADAHRLDLGGLHAEEGFFLLRGAEQRPLPAVKGERTWRFCGTFRGSPRTLREAVLELIRSARRKVFVTSFLLGDDEVVDALAATADRLPGGVYVISELDGAGLARGLARLAAGDETSEEVREQAAAHRRRVGFLAGSGVRVRGHPNCPAAFVVVDDETAWLGTANLDTAAFTRLGEVGVVIGDTTEVDRLARLFARMWLSGCTLRMPDAGEDAEPVRHEGVPADFDVPVATVDTRPGVLWTGPDRRGVLDGVHDVIGRAERDLLLAGFTLNGMLGRPDLLVNPVAGAIGRGVRVRMLVRARNECDPHRRDAGLLHELGVEIVADDVNHANAVVADGRHGMLFTATFDAEHGMDAGPGAELGARLDGTGALDGLAGYLRHAIDTATRDYVYRPIARRLAEDLGASWQHRWPLPGEVAVRADPPVWQRLVDAARQDRQEPVLWRRNGGPVELLLGRTRLALRPHRDGEYRLDELGRADRTARDELARWWRAPGDGEQRGYCPAVLHRIS